MKLLRNIPGLKQIIKKFEFQQHQIDELKKSLYRLQSQAIRNNHLKKYQNHEKINLVFVCHRPQVWNTLKTFFECCNNDPDFNVTIVAIPIKKQLAGNSFDHEIYESEGAEEFWKDFPCTVINGYDYEKKVWFDLRTLNPDYVFFQQPYNVARCEQYKSWNVAEYASICYISYYYAITSDDVKECMFPDFVNTVSLCFLQSKNEFNWFNEKFNEFETRNTKRFNVGCPRFENLENYRSLESAVWKLPKEKSFRVIWTPRWTTSETNCHFFEYKDKFFNLCDSNSDIDFVYRPHPQSRNNFAANNHFSFKENDLYELEYSKRANMTVDKNPDYLDLFYSSNVLVSDLTSLIAEYFVTGKPIIYCKNDAATYEIEGEWVNSFYIAHSWKEVEHYIFELKKGNDPLRSLRDQFIKSEFSFSEKSGYVMKEIIKKDFKGDL